MGVSRKRKIKQLPAERSQGGEMGTGVVGSLDMGKAESLLLSSVWGHLETLLTFVLHFFLAL